MEIVLDILDDVDGPALFVLGYLVLRVIVALLPRVARRVRRRRASRRTPAQPERASPPDWPLTLLVHVDEETEVLSPSLQLHGGPAPQKARITLELVDQGGTVRHASGRPLSPVVLGAEVPLPAFRPPSGATLEDVLGWNWDLILRDEGGEVARRREHPRPAGDLNPEAEIRAPTAPPA